MARRGDEWTSVGVFHATDLDLDADHVQDVPSVEADVALDMM